MGNALGLYMGTLGTARVMVPEGDMEEALALLEVDEELDELPEGFEDYEDSSSGVTKAVLGATAVALNPIGAGIALGLSYFMGSSDEDEAGLSVKCRECKSELELSREEAEQGWFVCPECNSRNFLSVQARCPNCQTELELDDTEVAQRQYRCSECDELVRLE